MAFEKLRQFVPKRKIRELNSAAFGQEFDAYDLAASVVVHDPLGIERSSTHNSCSAEPYIGRVNFRVDLKLHFRLPLHAGRGVQVEGRHFVDGCDRSVIFSPGSATATSPNVEARFRR